MTFAQWVGNSNSGVVGLLNTVVVPFIFALAFAVFVWGIVKYYFIENTSDESRAKGHQFVLWGVLGFALLFSMWGFINILLSTLGLSGQ